jgi:ligand-binding sensor domain-containing protein/AraC-like DNA-binding protein
MVRKRLRFLKVVDLFKGILCFSICCLLSLCPIHLSGLDPEVPIESYQLDHWSERSMLPGHSVYNMLQTSDGFLWVECSGGVVRFDGREFVPLYKLNPGNSGAAAEPTAPRDFFRTIMRDENGDLWLIKNCRYIIRYSGGRFTVLNEGKHLPDDVWLGMKDSFGNVWLGTAQRGLYCWRSGQFIEYGPEKGLPVRGISSILEDENGQVWVSTFHKGIFKLKGERFSHVPIQGIDGKTLVNWMYQDRTGIIWIGTNEGLFLKKNGRLTHITTADGLSHNAVVEMIQDSDGNIWVGTKSGINRIRGYSSGSIRIDSCLTRDTINVIFEDTEKNIWIGTEGKGLKRLRDAAFRTITLGRSCSNCITCLHQTSGGDIWVGTSLGDLMRIKDGKSVERFHFNHPINALADDRDKNLWIGSRDTGICRLTPAGRVIRYENALKGKRITCMYCDSYNRLWIGTTDGFAVYRNGAFTLYPQQQAPTPFFTFFFREDRRRNLWIGSRGLYLLKKGETDPGKITNTLTCQKRDYLVSCIFFDEDGSLWVGTPSGVIIRKKDEKCTVFADNIHWRNNMNAAINHIFKDDAGYLWMSTVDGILRINPRQLDELSEGKINWLLPREYGPSDGLRCGECAALSFHSVITPGKGEYWFGTKKGIAVLQTDKVKINKVAPPVVIEKVKVDGTDIPNHRPEYTFQNAGHLRFYFTAASLTSQEGVCFKYKLDGYDNDWIMLPPRGDRNSEYWNLNPGSYTFLVSACNNDGVWSRQGAGVTFTVTAAFWNTVLAKISLLTALLAVGLLGYFYFRCSLQKLKKEALREASVSEPGKDSKHLLELKDLLEEKKIYRDDGLSLKSLSYQLNVSDRYLSQLINEKLNKSFFDLINFYRVEDAKQMLLAEVGEKRNILEIAFEVGFNTKSAFNRAFKKHTRMTPSQFREEFWKKQTEA